MTTIGMMVSVHLDGKAGRRLQKAARLMNQSDHAFLESVADEVARRLVLDWAVTEYRRGGTFGELAEETGLAIEEIMEAMAAPDQIADAALPLLNDSAATDVQPHPPLYKAVERVMAELRRRP